jgi:hypothetical protein
MIEDVDIAGYEATINKLSEPEKASRRRQIRVASLLAIPATSAAIAAWLIRPDSVGAWAVAIGLGAVLSPIAAISLAPAVLAVLCVAAGIWFVTEAISDAWANR